MNRFAGKKNGNMGYQKSPSLPSSSFRKNGGFGGSGGFGGPGGFGGSKGHGSASGSGVHYSSGQPPPETIIDLINGYTLSIRRIWDVLKIIQMKWWQEM